NRLLIRRGRGGFGGRGGGLGRRRRGWRRGWRDCRRKIARQGREHHLHFIGGALHIFDGFLVRCIGGGLIRLQERELLLSVIDENARQDGSLFGRHRDAIAAGAVNDIG